MLRRAIFALIVVAVVLPAAAGSLPSRPNEILWRNPGNVAALDLAYGPGGREGRPRPPFRFLSEDLSGTSPKVKVRDARGRTWVLKWGAEAWASTFSSHFAWACGYIAETEYFIPRGRIDGAHGLHRAARYVAPDGSFEDARFQLRTDNPKFLTDHNWSWVNNPFIGTREFKGLRILMLLLSNWDAKDARDMNGSGSKTADSNLAIFEVRSKRPEYLYFVSDWGATMGKASSVPLMRDKWDPRKYNRQTERFIREVRPDGEVVFGIGVKHGHDVARRINVGDVAWLMRWLGRITDAQIERDLATSGATPEQVSFFAPALRERIRQLQDVVDRAM